MPLSPVPTLPETAFVQRLCKEAEVSEQNFAVDTQFKQLRISTLFEKYGASYTGLKLLP